MLEPGPGMFQHLWGLKPFKWSFCLSIKHIFRSRYCEPNHSWFSISSAGLTSPLTSELTAPYVFSPAASWSNCSPSCLSEEVSRGTGGLTAWQPAFINGKSPTLLWVGELQGTIAVGRAAKAFQMNSLSLWQGEQNVSLLTRSKHLKDPAFALMRSLFNFYMKSW